jgi:uncharacterized repeat protein (TIGR03847 family)
MGASFDFDAVDGFVPGAIGAPGRRVFYLQARKGSTVVTIKCEKQQVAALGDHLRRMLDDLPQITESPHPSTLGLREPVLGLWVLGSIGVAYDPGNDRIVLRLDEAVPVDADGEPMLETLEDGEVGAVRLAITRTQAAGFHQQAEQLVAAGRPSCRFCGLPIDPEGHPCPRMN